jgi:hypothetical protein
MKASQINAASMRMLIVKKCELQDKLDTEYLDLEEREEIGLTRASIQAKLNEKKRLSSYTKQVRDK